MEFNPEPFSIPAGIQHWLTVIAAFTAIGLVVAFILSLISRGSNGPALFGSAIITSVKDILGISLKRVLAITKLTFKEAIRRKGLVIFVVFSVIFMIAGWFLAGSNSRAPVSYTHLTLPTKRIV